MAKNEFLPFGTAANANIIPNADYQVLPARTAGFSSGVAKSEQMNTVWRQASTIASVVAQFIVNKSGMDALDNGDTAGLLENLEQAFAAQAKQTLPFTQSLGTSGYQTLPSGLIIQWGIINGTGSTSVTTNFPVKFPGDLFQSVATLRDMSGGDVSGVSIYANWIPDNEARKSTIKVGVTGSSIGTWTAKFIAIGY
ncbi:gp53-like domain-containing protein [Serratia plymuthica]|uniref:gp53-like domain-containing protein n=1 Tax=Serratia plymuthica TaxID=82996 RepID=UPI003DA270D9